MRTFNKAAIAGVAALALTFGATTTAVASETPSAAAANEAPNAQNPTPKDGPSQDSENLDGGVTKNSPDFLDTLSSNQGGSSEWGDRYDADKTVTGNDLLGSTKNWENQPEWAKIWYGLTVAGVLGTALAAIFAAVNQHLNFLNT